MTKHVIETVTFRLNEGVDRAEFIRAAETASDYPTGCDGFVARRLSSGADGSWIEHVEWETMDAAKAAAAGIGGPEGNRAFLSAIDGPSATMRHTELDVSVN